MLLGNLTGKKVLARTAGNIWFRGTVSRHDGRELWLHDTMRGMKPGPFAPVLFESCGDVYLYDVVEIMLVTETGTT